MERFSKSLEKLSCHSSSDVFDPVKNTRKDILNKKDNNKEKDILSKNNFKDVMRGILTKDKLKEAGWTTESLSMYCDNIQKAQQKAKKVLDTAELGHNTFVAESLTPTRAELANFEAIAGKSLKEANDIIKIKDGYDDEVKSAQDSVENAIKDKKEIDKELTETMDKMYIDYKQQKNSVGRVQKSISEWHIDKFDSLKNILSQDQSKLNAAISTYNRFHNNEEFTMQVKAANKKLAECLDKYKALTENEARKLLVDAHKAQQEAKKDENDVKRLQKEVTRLEKEAKRLQDNQEQKQQKYNKWCKKYENAKANLDILKLETTPAQAKLDVASSSQGHDEAKKPEIPPGPLKPSTGDGHRNSNDEIPRLEIIEQDPLDTHQRHYIPPTIGGIIDHIVSRTQHTDN
jgi:hypothetical protein